MTERQQAIVVGYLLLALAVAAPLLDVASLWPLAVLVFVVAGGLLWPALCDDVLATPVVVVVLWCTPAMLASDRLAVGSLAGAALAIALGEHLGATRALRYSTPDAPAFDQEQGAVATLTHAALAAGAMAVALLASVVPEARPLALAAVAALALVTYSLHRRRTQSPAVALPPPPDRLV